MKKLHNCKPEELVEKKPGSIKTRKGRESTGQKKSML